MTGSPKINRQRIMAPNQVTVLTPRVCTGFFGKLYIKHRSLQSKVHQLPNYVLYSKQMPLMFTLLVKCDQTKA